MGDGGGVGGGDGEVADFAAGAGGFAVVVAGDRGEPRSFCVREHSPDAVEHHGGARVGDAEWEAEDGAEVVFELRGVGAFDGPVAGVVDAGRHLVGEEVRAADEELDGEDADVFEAFEEVGEVLLGE